MPAQDHVWSCFVLVDETAENVLEEKVKGEYVTFRVHIFLLKVGEASRYIGCQVH